MAFNRCNYCGVRSKIEKCFSCQAIGIDSPLPIGITSRAPDSSGMNKQFRTLCYSNMVWVALCKDTFNCEQSYYVSRYREKDYYHVPRKAGIGMTVKVQSQLLAMSPRQWAVIMRASLLLKGQLINKGDCFLFANNDDCLLIGLSNYLSLIGWQVVRVVNGFEFQLFDPQTAEFN